MKIQLKEFDLLESTNLTAIQFAKEGAEEGTVVLARQQNGGKGRMKRVWSSPLGGLWFSMIMRPVIDPAFAPQITLLAGVAVATALRELYQSDDIHIKWPNDLLVHGKKICGILSELQLTAEGDIEYVVIGIGVNVALKKEDFPEELACIATSLNEEFAKQFSTMEVLQAILEQFKCLYAIWQQDGAKEILSKWKCLNGTLGAKVLVKDNDKVIFTGLATKIDEYGALVVENALEGARSFDFGEISIR